jgi:hypothetical protein
MGGVVGYSARQITGDNGEGAVRWGFLESPPGVDRGTFGGGAKSFGGERRIPRHKAENDNGNHGCFGGRHCADRAGHCIGSP